MQTTMITIQIAELQRQANEFEFNDQIISLFHLSLIFFAKGICLT